MQASGYSYKNNGTFGRSYVIRLSICIVIIYNENNGKNVSDICVKARIPIDGGLERK
ncbi:MAG: hypothetical protein METHSR3v1_320002 [Methanothrix sp.]|nr:MAG: hypothetical protein METHSR3v1_320002 [Methanothrix sp.]